VTFEYREDTNDWNTLWSALNEDEYGFASHAFEGWAIDIGAHIGSVTIGLLVDNPALRVVAVEPVPENAALIRENAERNGVTERLAVLPLAAAAWGTTETTLHYHFGGSEVATHHAFIGNSDLVATAPEQETVNVSCISLGRLIEIFRMGEPAVVKIDCEGCEYDVLTDPAVSKCPLILGEWHNTAGHTMGDVLGLLPGHTVTFSGPQSGPGGFVAVRA